MSVTYMCHVMSCLSCRYFVMSCHGAPDMTRHDDAPMEPRHRPMEPRQRAMEPRHRPMEPRHRAMEPRHRPMEPPDAPMEARDTPLGVSVSCLLAACLLLACLSISTEVMEPHAPGSGWVWVRVW